MVQVKIGIRNIVMPGARMQMIVVMKLTATRDRAETTHPQAHDPEVAADAGAVHRIGQRHVGEPAEGRALRVRKPNAGDEPAEEVEPIANMFRRGNATSGERSAAA